MSTTLDKGVPITVILGISESFVPPTVTFYVDGSGNIYYADTPDNQYVTGTGD